MITTWSHGIADENMAEAILVEQAGRDEEELGEVAPYGLLHGVERPQRLVRHARNSSCLRRRSTAPTLVTPGDPSLPGSHYFEPRQEGEIF